MSDPRTWFVTVARAEGTSLVLLLFVATPLKYVAGMPTATAWVGWLHGTLTILFVIALGSIARIEGWSWGRTGAAFLASLLPFGTFIFERTLPDVRP